MGVIIDRGKVKMFMGARGIPDQGRLAEKAGIDQDTVTKVLKGNGFRSVTLEALADALGVNPIDILTFEGYPAPHLAAQGILAGESAL
jgi:DNA-binding Xre family transcriptional regulator